MLQGYQWVIMSRPQSIHISRRVVSARPEQRVVVLHCQSLPFLIVCGIKHNAASSSNLRGICIQKHSRLIGTVLISRLAVFDGWVRDAEVRSRRVGTFSNKAHTLRKRQLFMRHKQRNHFVSLRGLVQGRVSGLSNSGPYRNLFPFLLRFS